MHRSLVFDGLSVSTKGVISNMTIERTFSIIKPVATERNVTGTINALIESEGLRIVAQKRILMTRTQAETFYAMYKANGLSANLSKE